MATHIIIITISPSQPPQGRASNAHRSVLAGGWSGTCTALQRVVVRSRSHPSLHVQRVSSVSRQYRSLIQHPARLLAAPLSLNRAAHLTGRARGTPVPWLRRGCAHSGSHIHENSSSACRDEQKFDMGSGAPPGRYPIPWNALPRRRGLYLARPKIGCSVYLAPHPSMDRASTSSL